MMMKFAVALAAVALPFVSAAPASLASRACDATEFSSGHYSLRDDYVLVTASGLKAEPGQTLTATVVDLATCTAYDGTKIALKALSGSAFDRDFVYLPEQGIPSAGSTVSINNVTWVAAVPNGSKNLDLSVTARFTPGSLENWSFAFEKLGVLYTAA